MFALGKVSLQRLEGLDPRLVAVVKRAIQLSKQDFLVVEGVRSPARQAELYAQGRTKPGNVVTWVRVSNHFTDAKTGLGSAVDLCPFPVDWNDPSKFLAIRAAMYQAADELDVALRWGGDWDCDCKFREKGETDLPHFELAKG